MAVNNKYPTALVKVVNPGKCHPSEPHGTMSTMLELSTEQPSEHYNEISSFFSKNLTLQ